MTRAATQRPRGATRPHQPQWRATARLHLQVYLYMWMWLWAICVVGVAVAIIVMAQVTTVSVSAVQFIRSGPLVWFLFGIAILVAAVYLTTHVANGMTRRSFVTGGLVAAVLSSLVHAATAAGLVLLEGALYDRMGWEHGGNPGTEPRPGIWEAGLGHLLADHAVLTLVGTVTGLLVGVAYYRLGGWWGSLALPLTVLPVLVVMFMTTWYEVPFVPWALPGWTAYVIGALLVLAAALAFERLTRRVPIARTES